MKKNLAAYLAIFASASFIAGFAPSLRATTATWTDTAATNAWETAGNWDINQVPTNNTFDVTISIPAPCNVTNQYQIGALNLSSSTAILNLMPGALIAIDSATGISNNGTIVVNTTGANNTTKLRFDANCPITGTGSVQLNGLGSAFNVADFDIAIHIVTIGGGQALRGHGTVSSDNGQLINNGTINADDAGAGTCDSILPTTAACCIRTMARSGRPTAASLACIPVFSIRVVAALCGRTARAITRRSYAARTTAPALDWWNGTTCNDTNHRRSVMRSLSQVGLAFLSALPPHATEQKL